MRREFFIHFAFWFSFFVLVSVFKNFLSLSYWPFWLGGLIGTVLPDVDHLIYVLFLNPHELTSQRVNFLLRKREILRVITLLYETRSERKNLVFHTFIFQIIFFAFTLFIISSSGSVFVYGIVLAFCLHIIVDQLADILEVKNLSNWGKLFSYDLDQRKSIYYLAASLLALCLVVFFV